MQLGEAVHVALVDELKHDESECTFCKSQSKPVKEKNVLKDNPDEDADLDGLVAEDGTKFKNDAAKLGAALEAAGEKQPKFSVVVLRKIDAGKHQAGEKVELPVVTAAHHLIPGNASLAKSKLYTSGNYLRTDDTAEGNIGYNVNCASNGVWLPGNYAQRPWGTKGESFAKQTGVSAQDYANEAMRQGGQFHDAHQDYSKFVLKTLNGIKVKLDTIATYSCPMARTSKKNLRNLYSIVARLDALSVRMQGMLAHPGSEAQRKKKWKVNVYTSSFVKSFIKSLSNHNQKGSP